MVYTVCDDCAPVLANDDMSAIEYRDRHIIVAVVADMGLVAHAGEFVNVGGYWRCAVCDWDQIGNGHLFESV